MLVKLNDAAWIVNGIYLKSLGLMGGGGGCSMWKSLLGMCVFMSLNPRTPPWRSTKTPCPHALHTCDGTFTSSRSTLAHFTTCVSCCTTSMRQRPPVLILCCYCSHERSLKQHYGTISSQNQFHIIVFVCDLTWNLSDTLWHQNKLRSLSALNQCDEVQCGQTSASSTHWAFLQLHFGVNQQRRDLRYQQCQQWENCFSIICSVCSKIQFLRLCFVTEHFFSTQISVFCTGAVYRDADYSACTCPKSTATSACRSCKCSFINNKTS